MQYYCKQTDAASVSTAPLHISQEPCLVEKYTETNVYVTTTHNRQNVNINIRNLDTNKERKYRIFRPITRALSIQKGSEIVKNEHARYTLERFPTDNAHVICTKKGIGKYGIMY